MSDDMCDMGCDELAAVARRAFQVGFEDGLGKVRRSTRNELAGSLNLPPRRKLHTVKIRQVYGAGYDIGDMHRRLNEQRATDQYVLPGVVTP